MPPPDDSSLTGRRAVLVLGMHRSGTSALTRVLNLMGVDLGPQLIPAAPSNRAGHWEHRGIVQFHDVLLEALGTSWDDPRPLRAELLRGEEARPFRIRIREMLERDFASSLLWGLKDPRLCRLLPLWDSILSEVGAEPYFVITSRHPDEVAASLARRNRIPNGFSRILWLDHLLGVERGTRGRRRSFVTYEALMEDWRPCVRRLADELGLGGEKAIAKVAAAVDSFLDPALRHHRSAEPPGGEGDSALDRWVLEAHDAVSQAAAGDAAALEARLDAVAREFDAAREALAPWVDHLAAEAAEAQQALKGRDAELGRLRAELVQRSAPEREPDSSVPVTRDYESPEGEPRVSIVIPLFNRVDLTITCLESLVEHTPAGLFEIVLIDNGSTDATAEFLESLEGNVKVVTNERNLGYAAACNQGARVASTDHVLLLDNDIEAKPGWLEPLLKILDQDPEVAAVGNQLLSPDGTMRHAGVAIVADPAAEHPLTPCPVHDQAPADEPAAGFASYYQALTGACLLVRRSVYEEVGGLDPYTRDGYEDVELCFRLQERGWKLVYEPASRLVHHESQSGPERFARSKSNTKLLNSRWLGKIEPDIVLEADGTRRPTGANHIRPYVPPPVAEVGEADLRTARDLLTSIVILTRNQMRHTRQCLASIERWTPEPHEIVIVDNGSTEDMLELLRQYVSAGENVRVVVNASNRGFAGGNNQGLALARGGLVCLLNNDTVVTEGWLKRMMAVLVEHPETGIVGPMTNYASGPQVLERVPYKTPEELDRFAKERAALHAGETEEARRLVAFCWLMRRSVIDDIGGFDEQFGLGNCEDDDYCVRAFQAGYRTRIARDAFVHHTGSQTFRAEKIDYKESMVRNFDLFKAKWGMDPAHPIGDGYPFLQLVAGPKQPRVSLPDLFVDHVAERGGRWLEERGRSARRPEKSGNGDARLRAGVLGGEDAHPELEKLFRRRGHKDAIPVWETTAALQAQMAEPGHVLLLGPDVILTDRALRELVSLARSDASLAAVGPTSNAAPSPQRVTGQYRTLEKDLRRFAAKRAKRHAGHWEEVPYLGGFCLLLQAEAVTRVGGLRTDLAIPAALLDLFGGLRAQGYRIACAKGAFVHHRELTEEEGAGYDEQAVQSADPQSLQYLAP